MKVSWEGAV